MTTVDHMRSFVSILQAEKINTLLEHTQFKNVVLFRNRIAAQHLRYAVAPNSRTIRLVCRRTSLVVMTPTIDIADPVQRCSCDLRASTGSLGRQRGSV